MINFLPEEEALALETYRTTNRLHPESLPAIRGMAWILATHPEAEKRDPSQAIYLGEYASEVTQRRDPQVLDALAAAYAAAGRFEEAEEAVEAAITIARNQGNPDRLDELIRRRDLYRRQTPFQAVPPQ